MFKLKSKLSTKYHRESMESTEHIANYLFQQHKSSLPSSPRFKNQKSEASIQFMHNKKTRQIEKLEPRGVSHLKYTSSQKQVSGEMSNLRQKQVSSNKRGEYENEVLVSQRRDHSVGRTLKSISPPLKSLCSGASSDRKDAEDLSEWYRQMKEKKDKDHSELINMCLRELVKQISNHCADRGNLLSSLFEDQKKLYSKDIESCKKEVNEHKAKREEKENYDKNRLEKLVENLRIQSRIAEGDKIKYKAKKNQYKKMFDQAEGKLRLLKHKYKILKEKWKKNSISFQGGINPTAVNFLYSTELLFPPDFTSPSLLSAKNDGNYVESIEIPVFTDYRSQETQVDKLTLIEEQTGLSFSKDQESQTTWSFYKNEKIHKNYSSALDDQFDSNSSTAEIYTQTHATVLSEQITQNTVIRPSIRFLTNPQNLINTNIKDSDSDDQDLQEIKKIKDSLQSVLEDIYEKKNKYKQLVPTLNSFIYALNTDGDFLPNPQEKMFISEYMDPIAWKAGYNTGLEEGKGKGFEDGEAFGAENGKLQGFIQAIQEIKENPNLLDREDSSENSIKDDSLDEWEELSKIKDEQLPKNVKINEDATEIKHSEENPNAEKNNRILKKASKRALETHKTNFDKIQKIDPRKPRFSLKNEVKPRKSRNSLVTVVREFNFNTKEVNNNKKKTNFGVKKFETFLKKSLREKSKKALMSRKMVLKTISSIYQAYISKPRTYEEDLVDIVHDEFFKKYGLRAVCDKKLIEFLSSLFNCSDNCRILIFMRLLGAASKIGEENWSRHSLMLVTSLWKSMWNSKEGKMLNNDDSADQIYFPISRAIECLKEKLENILPKEEYFELQHTIERASVADPKRINLGGIIDIDLFIERTIEVYEKYQISIRKGLDFILSLNSDNPTKGLERNEFELFVRNFSPQRLQLVIDDENLDNEDGFLSYDVIVNKAIEVNCLGIHDVDAFVYERFTSQGLFQIIMKARSILTDVADKLRSKGNTKVDLIEHRLKNLANNIFDLDPDIASLVWKVYHEELQRLNDLA